MTTNADSAALTRAEQAMKLYLSQRGRAGASGFDAFCAERPALAPELRELHGSLRRISKVLRHRPSPASRAWPRGWWRVA